MNYLMSIQILPTHPQSRDGYKYISEAIEIIEDSGLTHFVGPLETTIEGTMDQLFNLVKKMNNYLADEGCDRVISNIKLVQSQEERNIKTLLGDYFEFEDEY